MDHTLNDLEFTDAIYAQASLTLVILPEIASSTLPTTLSGNESTFLMDGTWQAGPILTVWYIPSIPGARGEAFGMSMCGTVCIPGDPAHAADPNNLLAAGGSLRNIPATTSQVYGQGGLYDQLTAGQIGLMLADGTGFVTPEPGTMWLFGSGTVLVWCRRRRLHSRASRTFASKASGEKGF